MLWNKVVATGLVEYTGVLVLLSQMVFVSRVPKCPESAKMRGEDIPQLLYIYIYVYTYYMYICRYIYRNVGIHMQI